LAGFNTT